MALRTPLSVTPHLYMGDSTGRPLDKGVVYFGEQDKDPEFYPINLFSDDALTKPLAQPVHTKGGYLYDKGDMVEPHAKEIIYSVKVLDSYGRKVFYKGAMMRNSWNDDVIEQINTALVSTAEDAAQIATNIAKDIADKAVITSGFITVDSFELGATITQRNEALRYAADGKLYRWAGDLPKVVPVGSTPESSGGIAANAWLEVSDTVLRQELSNTGLLQNAKNIANNRIVFFEDYVSDTTGLTDVTVEMQTLLDTHDGDIHAKPTSVFKTTKTLFNKKSNRTIDFKNAKIVNKTNSRYAIVSISPAFTGTTDLELLTFMKGRYYGQEIVEAHIKDLQYEMQPNTIGGGNLGVGIVYGDNCTLRKLFPKSTNGNGTEIRNSIQCGLYESDLSNFRNYSAFIFMSKKCTVSKNRFSGGVDGLILKQNRDGDADCGHIVSYNIFDDAGTAGNAIGGGVWKETALTDDIYVPDHQWVDGVEIYGNTFICRTTLQKVSPSVYSRDWDIHNNTFKCNDLAGTLIQIGGQGNPTSDMVLSGGHKFHNNHIYNIDSPANALIDARLNCSIYDNKFYNVKAIYLLYVRDTMSGTQTDSVEFYDNEFIDCGIYCSGSGSHGFSATVGNKRFRFSGNKGTIKALVRGASANLTALYSASESTELYDNKLTFISTAGINSITAQSFGATKISRLNNQTLTVDATIPSVTATALQISAATEVQDEHVGNKYILKGTATTARAVSNSADMIDGNNTYIGDWTTRIYNNFAKPVSRLLVDRQSATRPTAGTWLQGDFVRNTNPTVSAGFVVFGWLRLTAGEGNVLGTDWVEIKQTTTP